jgi:hypothetical protein
MRQEHLLAAKVFHYLYDHIDHDRLVLFCPDGEAAKRGVREGILEDATVPDLSFFFLGGDKPLTAEVKIVEKDRIKFCGDSEPNAWHTGGFGQHKPMLWIGANEQQTEFYLWEHAIFASDLGGLAGCGVTSGGRKKTLMLDLPSALETYNQPAALADALLGWARKQPGLYPPADARG